LEFDERPRDPGPFWLLKVKVQVKGKVKVQVKGKVKVKVKGKVKSKVKGKCKKAGAARESLRSPLRGLLRPPGF
jgi:hypothetical protein